MFKKAKQFMSQGIFRSYFIKNYIKSPKGEDAFSVFYEDRITAIFLTHLFNLEYKVEDGKISASANGKNAELTFSIIPGQDNSLAFEQDINSLIDYQDFLVDVANRFFEYENIRFEDPAEMQYYVVNYLLAHKNMDSLAYIHFRKTFHHIRAELHRDLLHQNNLDQNVVMSTARFAINKLESEITMTQPPDKIKPSKIRKILRSYLAFGFSRPAESLKEELEIAQDTPKSEHGSTFLAYIKQMRIIEAHPEMW